MLPVIPTVHIHLITAKNPQDLEERCCEARKQAKTLINEERDKLMVKEVVIPFYHEMVRNSDITHLVPVFDDCSCGNSQTNVVNPKGERIHIEELVETMMDIIYSVKLPRLTYHSMEVSQPYYDLIQKGIKPVEGRKISNTWKKVKRGDSITMMWGEKSFDVIVSKVNMYLPSIGDPLTAYLENETLERTLPGVSSIEEGRKIYLQWSSEDEIKEMGMMGIEVRVV
jgi:ASC-1-like (ASCH) protein